MIYFENEDVCCLMGWGRIELEIRVISPLAFRLSNKMRHYISYTFITKTDSPNQARSNEKNQK
jgi:hypothetical protein